MNSTPKTTKYGTADISFPKKDKKSAEPSFFQILKEIKNTVYADILGDTASTEKRTPQEESTGLAPKKR